LPHPKKESGIPFAPLYMKFGYKYEWRHLPLEEFYPIWTVDDFKQAINIFRKRHGSQGELIVYATEDFVEWWEWGKVPGKKTCASLN
jgi:hypothetical protein